MPRRQILIKQSQLKAADGDRLRAAFAALRTDLALPAAFPADVLAEAETAAKNPRLPDHDATDIPLFTVDPAGSMDLDQAMHLERRPGGGYRVQYAIADVAAFVTPDGAIDNETHRRVETLYLPDGRIPLHPPTLSETAASLLPDNTAPALLWTLDLDADGELTATDVRRSLVRSRARFDYHEVQKSIDAGLPEFALLKEIGLLREALERERGGISLPIPEQEITEQGDTWHLEYRSPMPSEGWNAQISLLTGMAAADLMVYAGTGILRTLPEAPVTALERLRRVAGALDVDWPEGATYGEVIRSLDPTKPRHAAFLEECTALLRGAGYTAFDGGIPEQAVHAAVADEYTHVTAPLRRLVDRYSGEVCLSLVAGTDVPDWVLRRLPALPKEMESGSKRGNEVEREAVDLVEAVLLSPYIGEEFDAVVTDLNSRGDGGIVMLRGPAVRAKFDGPGLKLGEPARVRLTQADEKTRKVRFAPA